MRLIVRPDLDGLTCAVFLKQVESISEVVLVEPHALQSGQVAITGDDLIANLPYATGCGMWFDHHASNAPPPDLQFRGAFHVDPSAARTIYNYYQDPRLDRFQALLEATDRVDSGALTLDDVVHPEGYVLIGMTLDPRSNLAVTDAYYHLLIDLLERLTPDEILRHPEVDVRCTSILAEQGTFEAALRAHSRAVDGVVINDFRPLAVQPIGSRFLVYALFPDCHTSIKLYPARGKTGEVGISLGHSIFNRRQTQNMGAFCARYGGGGHAAAGSMVVPADRADAILEALLPELMRI